jgi:hypothetical protein
MSNPRDSMSDPSEVTQAYPHPVSQHRTPREIAADEAGPIGNPDLDVVSKEASAASAEAKTQAKRPPPEIISKKQRKRR